MSSPSAISSKTPSGKAAPAVLDGLTLARRSKFHSKDLGSQAIVDGATLSWQLPPTGLLHRIWVTVTLSVTIAGTVTGGTWQNRPPVPYTAINNISFGNNSATLIRNVSGWGNYKYERAVCIEDVFDPLGAGVAYSFSNATQLLLGTTGGSRPTAGAAIAAGTFTFNHTFPISLSISNAAELGLIVLQQDQSYWTLAIQMGTLISNLSATGGTSALVNALAGTGLSYSIAAGSNITVGIDYFDPLDPTQWDYSQLLSHYVQVTEMSQAPIIGNNIITIPKLDVLSVIINEVINNNAPVADANLTALSVQYAGSQVAYADQKGTLNTKYMWAHGGVPPIDGTWVYDMGQRKGIPGRRDAMDGIDNSKITGLQCVYTLSGVALTNAIQNTTMEAIRPITQAVN